MSYAHLQEPGAVMYPPAGQPLGQPVQQVIVQGNAMKPVDTKSKTLLGLGITQVILGSVMFICNIILYITWDSIMVYSAAGLWMGIIVLIAGGFGIAAGKQLSKCRVVTHLVMSIISSVLIWALFATAVMGAIFDSLGGYSFRVCRPDGYCYSYHVAGIVLNTLLAIVALVEFVIAVIASAWTCKIMCAQHRSNTTQVLYVAQPAGNPAAMTSAYPAYQPPAAPHINDLDPTSVPIGSAVAPATFDPGFTTKQ